MQTQIVGGNKLSVELKDGVYWVGAIDWNIRDFHGYTTPKGTTYNAYLIVDEKIVVVDTVKHGFFDDMLRGIKEIVDPREIDYVVSNHVEKDHSGSLSDIMRLAKNAEIYATGRGKEGLIKYFKQDWTFNIVKTGDELNIGKKNLMFIEAPMLHWPDSMFTYIKEDRILLPNDAFGQHIATHQRFDDEVKDVMEDAATYYANILMPLAPLILKKIEEIVNLGIKIDMIGPSHGIIWRKEPEKIINAYIDWSKGVARDKILIVYDTMWGSTEKIARSILRGINKEGVEAKLLKLRENHRSAVIKEVLDSKVVLVGSPTINNGIFPTVADFLTYLKGLKPKKKIGATFGSYGWGGGACKVIEKELREIGFEVLDANLEFKYVPDESELERCVEFGKELVKKL